MLKYIFKGVLLVIQRPVYSYHLLKHKIFTKFLTSIRNRYNLEIIYNYKNMFDIVMSGKGAAVETELMRGVFEDYLVNFYKNNLKTDSVFFDIGANVGLFSLLGGSIIKKGQTYSFDADVEMIDLTTKSVKINSFDNVHVKHSAISNTDGELSFNIVEDPAYNSLGKVTSHRIKRKITVPATTLDSFISQNNITCVDFIKIDIEGAELLAMQGAEKMLTDLKPIISLEFGEGNFSYFDYTSKDLLDFMYNKGYEVYNYRNNILEKEIIKEEYVYDNLIFIPNNFNISQIR